ncbi:SEC-C metal-binding domain-containing protein [Marivirga harenae]|uniref:SEC-C metal-binding domain-containing protein n=1 Tax=Marivirga harenae TaxID=2010992 RepID=UPI0026DF5DEF|nr:SEC-C metal-binding domain-containing protein [Marivirga harenae]WKV12617.1 SEC-C metal-binding domain-containing protein [Marivirga harenae]|tara:strand:+ start:14546 stop:14839 length:294 start_codon:yes stop_codon:yes gene_type:complete
MKKELGRNEPCHCGSGKKYKNCHMGKESSGINNNKNLMYIAIFVVILAIAGFSVYYNSQQTAPVNTNSSRQGLTPPPAGEAPPGKVWSAEHGHWHDK